VFTLDAHIEPLLALPATVSLPSLLPYTDGRLIAQDKASCIPAWILLSSILADADAEAEAEANLTIPETFEEKEIKREKRKGQGVKVIDSTAAPGNKTTMAAAMAGEDGRIIAIERDAGRYKVLKEMCAKAGAKSECPLIERGASTDERRRCDAYERGLPRHRPRRPQVQERLPLPRRPFLLFVPSPCPPVPY
jgi:putative methyltransferase